MSQFTCTVDGLCVNVDFAIQMDNYLIAAGLFDHSKTKVQAVACKMGYHRAQFGYRNYITQKEEYNRFYEKIPMEGVRDNFYYCLVSNTRLGKDVVITTEEDKKEDFYNFFMSNYKLPLLKEWIPSIVDVCDEKGYLKRDYRPVIHGSVEEIPLNGKQVLASEIQLYCLSGLDNDKLTTVVSELLRKRRICITKEYIPHMEIDSFDSYIQKYGRSLVENLEKQISPLRPLKGEVDGFAAKHKRLYPQQAACVNGIIELKRAGKHYAIANEGMGCGKTLQGVATIDGYFNEEYLRKNPGKTLKDCYAKGAVNYRVIVMAPGHLVEKWAEEIETEVPLAKAIILRDFSQLVEIREKGKERNGKEYYILSKDFCKLGEQNSPIPSMVKKVYPSAKFCKDCYEDRGVTIFASTKNGVSVCPDCGGQHFKKLPMRSYGMQKGLICHRCNELLLTPSAERVFSGEKEPDEISWFLEPRDFESRKQLNSTCYHCGAELWGVNAKPLDCGGEFSSWVRRKPKWSRYSYFTNLRKKGRVTSWGLKGYTDEIASKIDVTPIASEYGPRKTAPSRYIKKYLKGYFDFCILDEAHKYEGAGTAQANAAHALMKASDFTIGLTGTIANGSAGSFYYLLYMLDPDSMKKRGYEFYGGYKDFVSKYGSFQSTYVYDGSAIEYNSNSRGRKLTSDKEKPGISPMLFVDFLLEHCVFLDITDLSKFLPPLVEEVALCKAPDEVMCSYRHTIDVLKEAIHSQEGRSMMSQILNYGLSYLDKPYGRNNIISAYEKDLTIATIDNFDEYGADKLMPKEERLVEIVREEMAQDRNCFVYASYTGDSETCITHRIKQILEEHCNLRGRVAIIESQSPAPIKREAWIKKKASEGIKVFITNPKNVETGLDFCFKYNGKSYNYPTLIFMQMSYEMSVIWQASRRHYRLNQRERCRTVYLAYEDTLQASALEIMAAKQVATSAIQGKFSSEGLAAMAKGVDARTQLAAALSSKDLSTNSNSLENMFDALNASNNASEDDYADYIPPKTYYEVMGMEEPKAQEDGDIFSMLDNFDTLMKPADELDSMYQIKEEVKKEEKKETKKVSQPCEYFGGLFASFEDAFLAFSSFDTAMGSAPAETKTVSKKPRKSKKSITGQMSVSDLFVAG